MAEQPKLSDLTRRERQIIEVIYRFGKASAVEVVDNLPDEPNNATIRTMLGVLEDKGFLRHETVKGRYIYYPTIPIQQARQRLLQKTRSQTS